MTEEILEEIKTEALAEFEMLSKIYRPSFKTRKIADYLKARIKELAPDIVVYEDEYRANLIDDTHSARESSGNIWFDIPANSPALENNQPIILQCHMDMVVSFKTNEALENLKQNGVDLEYHSNGTLTSFNCQTTLGADDGIAIGFMLAILKCNNYKHGKIRCIITADEEVGMCGATYLGLTSNGEKGGPVQGFNYLVNIDNLTDGEIIVSTLGAAITKFMYPVDLEAKPLDSAAKVYRLDVDKLIGGHDGLNIEGHASAVWLAVQILKNWMNLPDFRLIEFLSPDSEFQNVIQKRAVVTFATNKTIGELRADMEKTMESFHEEYPQETEAIAKLDLIDIPADTEIRPYSHEIALAIMNILVSLPFGIVSWKDKNSGWLESCANMGPIYLTYEKGKEGGKNVWYKPTFMMKAHFRSCNNEALDKSVENNRGLAKKYFGNDDLDYFQRVMIMYGWAGNKDQQFVEVAKRAFQERMVKWYACNTRSGLEVSWFKFFNENLNMISIGPECHHMHDCAETLYTETLTNVIAVILTCIDKMRILKPR